MLPKKGLSCSANRIDEGQGVREVFLGEEELVLNLGETADREQNLGYRCVRACVVWIALHNEVKAC